MSVTDRLEEERRRGGTVAMSYVILESTDKTVLAAEVHDWSQDGWVCQGGVAIAVLPPTKVWPPVYTVHYAQAMVFDEDDTSWVASDEEEEEE